MPYMNILTGLTTSASALKRPNKLGVHKNRIFKTLVVELDNKTLAAGIVPVAMQLNMKLIA